MTSDELIPPVELSAKDRKHSWIGENRIIPADSPDGNERCERACIHCGLIKVTVHGGEGFPWREWRKANGERVYGQATPPCLDGVKP